MCSCESTCTGPVLTKITTYVQSHTIPITYHHSIASRQTTQHSRTTDGGFSTTSHKKHTTTRRPTQHVHTHPHTHAHTLTHQRRWMCITLYTFGEKRRAANSRLYSRARVRVCECV